MVFSSITFLYYFLPLALLLHRGAPQRWKNLALLLASLLFYGWGEPRFLWIMLLSLIQGHLAGRWLERTENSAMRRLILTASLTMALGILGLFKYADFFLAVWERWTGWPTSPLHLRLPIGISFYTFQLVSYLIDVYRGTVPAQRSFIDLATYITMFPQLIAGPIVRYADIRLQLARRVIDRTGIASGLRRFMAGLGKKVLLANTLGELAQTFRSSPEPSTLFVWLYAAAFSLQIYYDFSGYSDMAIGLGRMLGFSFPENFNYPFTAVSISYFWRRWHISLGTWFRDYVYIPLGGSRQGPGRQILNLLIVWALTGLWHGASWTFVVWGLYFGGLLILEKRWFLWPRLGILRHVLLLTLVAMSFVLFDATDLATAGTRLLAMWGLTDWPWATAAAWYELRSHGFFLLAAALGATAWPAGAFRRIISLRPGSLGLLEGPGLLVLAVVITAFLVDGSFNPFLYFRF